MPVFRVAGGGRHGGARGVRPTMRAPAERELRIGVCAVHDHPPRGAAGAAAVADRGGLRGDVIRETPESDRTIRRR